MSKKTHDFKRWTETSYETRDSDSVLSVFKESRLDRNSIFAECR